MPTIALGVPVLTRTKKLQELLCSISTDIIDRVYIAENGPNRTDRQDIYESAWQFELEVIHLDNDCGLGKCYHTLATRSDEDYFIRVDSDMEIPDNILSLVEILENSHRLGGVSGILLENSQIRSGCSDLHEDPLYGNSKAIVKDIRSSKFPEYIEGFPIVYFDYITNAAVFKRECIDDYIWDKNLMNSEHLDFYIGHKRKTNWRFGVCPEVVFKHKKGGKDNYMRKYRYKNGDRISKSRDFVSEKWGYDQFYQGTGSQWITTNKPTSNVQTTKNAIKSFLRTKDRVVLSTVLRNMRNIKRKGWFRK